MTTELISGPVAQPAVFMLVTESERVDRWVYFFGNSDGSAVKIGKARDSLTARRRNEERGQHTELRLVLLAAVRGYSQQETAIKAHFDHLRPEWSREQNNTEVFLPDPELTEYINWLRQQYFTWTNEDDGPDDVPDIRAWCPGNGRRVPLDAPAPDVLVQDYDIENGALSGTPWAPMTRPLPPHNDYYTPVEIVAAAREGMGGIDLDPATHWVAARAQGIEHYYHQHKSAFDNPWSGRVWLNPPYGENDRWFTEIIKYWDSHDIEQLCMLSPAWAFTTKIARPVIERSSAMLLLSPTPKFWGRHRNGRVVAEGEEELGVNHPHLILYMGHRPREFSKAYAKYGIPMQFDLSLLAAGGELCRGSPWMTRFIPTQKCAQPPPPRWACGS